MKKWASIALCLGLAVPAFAADEKGATEQDRLKASYQVLRDVMAAPDKGIPHDLLNKSECVIVVPAVKKAAFIVGGSYGRGVMTCRSGESFKGPWSAPAFYAIEGGSFGLQIADRAAHQDVAEAPVNSDGTPSGSANPASESDAVLVSSRTARWPGAET